MTKFDESSAADYKFTHGKSPKGTGLWLFSLHRNGASTDVQIFGLYSAAKKSAIREARSLGCDTVTVNT
jgi:hypothetical protein